MLDLVSISAVDVVIESFSLSADVPTIPIRWLRFDGARIWIDMSGTPLPTGSLQLNSGSIPDRTLAAGASPKLELHFHGKPSGTVTYTLVIVFTDGTDATLVFAVDW